MWNDLWFRLRCLFRRKRAESELDDELRFHYEQETEKYVQAGMRPEEAQRRVRLMFGGLDQVKEECRDARGLRFLETTLLDARYAARMFRKSPGFTATALLTLAIGIGANTAIFSVLDGVLLKPLPYPHPDQLVSLEICPLALDPSLRGMAPEDYFVFREQGRTFQDIGLYLETDADRDVNVTGLAEPERVHALRVTDGTLSLLGVVPVLGRIFSRSDDSPAAAATVVLTYGYWERHFSSDPAAVGRLMIVDGKAREIIGVLPRHFHFLDQRELALILPLQLSPNQIHLGDFSYFGIARLKEGKTLDEASADVGRMLPITLTAFPAAGGVSLDLLQKAHLAPSLLPLKQDVVGNVGTLLWVLMGGIALVLLIACANVANLLLVRTTARRHELALRAALGASRRRLAAQLLHENAILGLLGGALGLGLSWAALPLLIRLVPFGLPRINQIGIDVPVLLFTLAIALFTTFLFGLIPVLKFAAMRSSVPESGRTVSAGRERHRAQDSLVVVQVGLALVLLVCSGLMLRTFRVLARVNPGFVRPPELQTFRISIPPALVPDEASIPHMEQQIQDKLAAIPGISAVGFASTVPMDGDNRLDNVFAADRAYEQATVPPLRHLVFISPGYVHTMGIPLIAGHDLDWADIYNRVPAALISENFAREYWRTPAAALGKRIRISADDDWREIVGVVGDVHDENIAKPARTAVYWPILLTKFQNKPLRAERYVTFVVRSPLAGSETLMKQIRQSIWSVNANLPLGRVYTLDHLYRLSLARTSFTLLMLAIAGGMALLLGTVGLYGVVAYSVSQRTREIGIRIALGAMPRSILALVFGRGLTIISAGLVLGAASALLLSRLLASMLFGVRSNDPLTYAAAVPLLGAVALAACYVPAHRAIRIEPVIALRCE